MGMMKTYFDENRIAHEADRRFHAADLEKYGGKVQVVPAVLEQMTPLVAAGAWGRNEQYLRARTEEAKRERNTGLFMNLQKQRWWNEQWRQADGLYHVDRLDEAERLLANRLLSEEGFPQECFPDAEGPLIENNDARIVAEVVAKGGTMLITSDTTMVDEPKMERWYRIHKDRFGLTTPKVVYNVDELYIRWAEHPGADHAFMRTALGAFWPERRDAGRNAVRESVEEGVDALVRGHMPRFGRVLKATLSQSRDIRRLIDETRLALPEKMRKGEDGLRTMLKGAEPVINENRRQKMKPGKKIPSGYAW